MKILILMSTFNGVKYIKEQLDSIRLQQDEDVSLLIRDDGSKDESLDIITNYIIKHPDFNIELIKGENVGFALSFTKLLYIAYQKYENGETFDYYAFADQDDVWLPEKLYRASQMLDNINQRNKPITYCSNTTLVRSNLSVIGNNFRSHNILKTKESAVVQNIATGCTMVFNIQAVETYVTHPLKVIKVHDFYMYQLCTYLGEVIFDFNSYILYRQHGNNQIGKPSLLKRWKKRILKIGHYNDHELEMQSRYLLDALSYEMSENDNKLISKVAFYKKNMRSRLNLLFDNKIHKQTFEQNFFYKFKIILGIL